MTEIFCRNAFLLAAGLFHRLMSRVAQNVGSEAELYHRQIYRPFAENHWLLVQMTPHPEALIKVGPIYLCNAQ